MVAQATVGARASTNVARRRRAAPVSILLLLLLYSRWRRRRRRRRRGGLTIFKDIIITSSSSSFLTKTNVACKLTFVYAHRTRQLLKSSCCYSVRALFRLYTLQQTIRLCLEKRSSSPTLVSNDNRPRRRRVKNIRFFFNDAYSGSRPVQHRAAAVTI